MIDPSHILAKFNLIGEVALVTGAGGLLGPKHTEALVEAGAFVYMTDWHLDRVTEKSKAINEKYGNVTKPMYMDVTDPQCVDRVVGAICDEGDGIDILINNAAKDPKVKKGESMSPDSRFETMPFKYWQEGIDACVNGTFLVSQAVANVMLSQSGGGVILNIASDLGVIAPDQRIYRKEGVPDSQQNVKPITYSAAKWAVVGMTKYLAVYFADKGIRVNCLSPTGVYNNHPEEFVAKLSSIIPMGRMSDIDEYKATVVYMCSDASSYMTGHNLIVDGGKTVW
jgi:NAD(P)-dependent dehydrogenase (short-subunit alcohol dehydrogenase family)